MEIETFSDIEKPYWWLKKNPKRYKSVVLDTCTQLQTLAVHELMAGRRQDKQAKEGKRKKRLGDWGSMTKRDWGDVAALMKEWLGNYRDLTQIGLQVIFIAQDRTFNLGDEEDIVDELLAPEIGPALSPSVAKFLNASASAIGNTYIRERHKKGEKRPTVEYCLGLAPSSLYIRKVRKPKGTMPEDLVDPHWDDVVDIIKGE